METSYPGQRVSRALVLCLALFLPAQQGMSGEAIREFKAESRLFRSGRTVRVRLPASYQREPERRYPVLYLHDGQNVFSTAGTNCCFGWGNWDLDGTASRLEAEGRMREIIMVSVDNSRFRYTEYRGPAYPYTEEELAARSTRPSAAGDDTRYTNYVTFLIEELKPRIDGEYRTMPGPATTAVMGSSMGGICSLAMAWEHPETFGGAASLSGAFQVERSYFLNGVLKKYEGAPKPFRVYLDSGVVDFSGGDDGCRLTEQVAGALQRIGWKQGRDMEYYVDREPLTEEQSAKIGLRQDKWAEAHTSQHNEFYWRVRAWRPLIFLYPPTGP